MTTARSAPSLDDVFSVHEIADAAGVSLHAARTSLHDAGIATFGGYVGASDAIGLVRALALGTTADRAAVTTLDDAPRRSTRGLIASALLHAGGVAALVLAIALGVSDTAVDASHTSDAPAHLVFFSLPGPSGGGGGGGVKTPLPVRRAMKKSIEKKSISSPVPPPPPEPKVEPPKSDPPPPPPAVVQAPVAPIAADPVEAGGTIDSTAATNSQGSGTAGGAGTGAGTGMGEGQGAGIGDGSGAGIGGGPYRPGADIEPPKLLREVKPAYTDAARRRGVEGEVLVEIVVRRDGTVGDVRLVRGLGEGLDAKAVDAVRQWRFEPATRHGTPVDVYVEVSLQFKLR